MGKFKDIVGERLRADEQRLEAEALDAAIWLASEYGEHGASARPDVEIHAWPMQPDRIALGPCRL